MRPKNGQDRLFDQVEHDSLSNIAVGQIENLILSGVLREGDELPSERELAQQMGISRPKVREALKVLTEIKLVKVIANEGAFIAQLGGNVMSQAMIDLFKRTPSAILDNLEYRRENEAFASRLAAQRATENDRKQLRKIIEEMENAEGSSDSAHAAELDVSLHSTIVFAGYNRTLIHMMTALYNLNRSSVFYNRMELINTDHSSVDFFEQHQAIVEAICLSRPDQAEKEARAHMDYVIKLVKSAFERKSREALSLKRY